MPNCTGKVGEGEGVTVLFLRKSKPNFIFNIITKLPNITPSSPGLQNINNLS